MSRELTRQELAADVEKFIDGSATALDWDDFVTFSLRDADLERMRQECLEVLLEPQANKEKPWISDEGLRTLSQILQLLKAEPNQPPQRNAGSRPFSDDSPASETPSALGPRG